MFIVRFAILALLVFAGLSWGAQPSDELNAIGKLGAGLVFVAIPALYMLPTYEAWKAGHPRLAPIAAVNVFLGWSLLGWVVALVWAFTKPEPKSAQPA